MGIYTVFTYVNTLHPGFTFSLSKVARSGLRGELSLEDAPFPQVDIIGAMVIVWRVRGKTIRSVLCNNCAQCNAHTYEQT